MGSASVILQSFSEGIKKLEKFLISQLMFDKYLETNVHITRKNLLRKPQGIGFYFYFPLLIMKLNG